VPSGPLYRAFQRRGREMVLHFEGVGSGLAARGGEELVGFEMAGQDGVFHPATARIEGGVRVVLSAPQVEDPERVRYAWAPFPAHNLINKEGLPASTFCNYGAVVGR
jgi:sialate O-acetylesterase